MGIKTKHKEKQKIRREKKKGENPF